MKVFKPFIDGIIKYDCRKCRTACCIEERTIPFDRRLWKMLIKDFPFYKYFAYNIENRKKPFRHVIGKAACRFLDKDGRCFIQKRYGYKFKPLQCRAHPYYLYKCNDEYVINPIDSCIMSLNVRRDVVRNKEVNEESKTMLKNMKDLIKAKIFREVNWTKDRLLLEKRILQESKRYLDKANYEEFAIRQLQMAYKDVSTEDIKQQVLKKIKLWQQFLKMEDINLDNRRIAYELTAITSLLRFDEYKINEKTIPIVLLALYLLMLFSSHAYINKDNILVSSYTSLLYYAKRLIFLIDDHYSKVKLLSYVGISKKKIASLIKDNSIIDLAEKLHLSIEDRCLYILESSNK